MDVGVTACVAVVLTDRELEVAELVASGRPNDAIARRLGISSHTVGQHVRNIFRKVGANSKAELVARLYVAGLLCAGAWPPLRRQ
jgi:DNA-binding CsgD family transcriptional regulator